MVVPTWADAPRASAVLAQASAARAAGAKHQKVSAARRRSEPPLPPLLEQPCNNETLSAPRRDLIGSAVDNPFGSPQESSRTQESLQSTPVTLPSGLGSPQLQSTSVVLSPQQTTWHYAAAPAAAATYQMLPPASSSVTILPATFSGIASPSSVELPLRPATTSNVPQISLELQPTPLMPRSFERERRASAPAAPLFDGSWQLLKGQHAQPDHLTSTLEAQVSKATPQTVAALAAAMRATVEARDATSALGLSLPAMPVTASECFDGSLPERPRRLTEGMQSPQVVAQTKSEYARNLDDQLQQGIKVLQDGCMKVKQDLRSAAWLKKQQFNADVDREFNEQAQIELDKQFQRLLQLEESARHEMENLERSSSVLLAKSRKFYQFRDEVTSVRPRSSDIVSSSGPAAGSGIRPFNTDWPQVAHHGPNLFAQPELIRPDLSKTLEQTLREATGHSVEARTEIPWPLTRSPTSRPPSPGPTRPPSPVQSRNPSRHNTLRPGYTEYGIAPPEYGPGSASANRNSHQLSQPPLPPPPPISGSPPVTDTTGASLQNNPAGPRSFTAPLVQAAGGGSSSPAAKAVSAGSPGGNTRPASLGDSLSGSLTSVWSQLFTDQTPAAPGVKKGQSLYEQFFGATGGQELDAVYDQVERKQEQEEMREAAEAAAAAAKQAANQSGGARNSQVR